MGSIVNRFLSSLGQSYVVQTPADEFAGRRYFRLSTHKQSFAFEVVACKDAIVSLSNGSHTVAEVIIGAEENTKTIIRSLEVEQPTQVENSTIGILNCDSRRGFWIQFVYDFVRFGQGDLNEGLILELHIKFLTVEALSISTKGVRGIWTLNQQSGELELSCLHVFFDATEENYQSGHKGSKSIQLINDLTSIDSV